MSKIITSGIYKITNTVTKEFYVGCSTNIQKRWQTHCTRYKNVSSKEYNKPLYQAMREYGLNSFVIEILEEVPEIENIFKREYFYIKELNACENGYNEEYGGEKHGRAKLCADDVADIRERYGLLESKRNVYIDYSNKIGKKGFHKVWNGYTWPDIRMDVYTPENKAYYKNDTGSAGETNSRTKLTNEEVANIRVRKKAGEKQADVYEEFKDRLTRGSFRNLWYGYNWKNIA